MAHGLARAGLTARGVIYILIGFVAVAVAVGQSGREADQQGAIQLLAGKPYGLVALWLLGIGFVGYALWRLSEAAFGVAGEGTGAGPRLKSLGRAVVYGSFAVLVFEALSGAHNSQSREQQDLTAKVMRYPAGQWLAGLAGLIVVAIGAFLVIDGVRRKFMKCLETAQMSARTKRAVKIGGTIGSIARGVVIALAGVLVIDAAMTHDSSKSGGIDKALLTLRDQPSGEALMLAAAVGLLIFGIYGLCEARWRKV